MLFIGYWSLWFLIGFVLTFTKKISFKDGQGKFSFLTLLVFSFILAVPSSLVHCTFIK
jgi:hypothetical protein